MKLRIIGIATAIALASLSASAATCEATFQKKGNILTGTQFTASVDVTGQSPAGALTQIREAGRVEGLDVVNDDVANGSLLLEEPEAFQHKAIPVLVSSSAQNGAAHVEMTIRTGKGAMSSGDAMRDYMCKLLAAVKPGKVTTAGVAPSRAPTPVVAWQFAQKIQRESHDSVAAIDSRYKGKTYRIKGAVANVHGEKGNYAVFFKKSAELAGGADLVEASLMCRMASNQSSYALSLRDGDRIELTGTFERYNVGLANVVIADCKP